MSVIVTSSNSNAKVLSPSIYLSTVTLFRPTLKHDLDVETHIRHMEFPARFGITGVVFGISMDTGLICRLTQRPSIIGIKYTYHDAGRIARDRWIQETHIGSPFTILGGATSYLLDALAVEGSRAITGLANVAPRLCVRVFDLWRSGQHEEALKHAGTISTAE
nr:hypothetical protein L204_01273 [Cryptococcus depauperatus CBS 7855]